VSVLNGKVNNWQHVSVFGSDGWVFTKYIQPVQCQSATRYLREEVESNCDSLAANPNDQRRSGNGVPYEELGAHAANAVEACTKAVEANRKELRFQYQLGRALEFVNRSKAMEIHDKLVKAKYPAAYDNLGWLMYWDKKDAAQAVNYFRMGVELGDPDSMVSLADMIDRGEYIPPNADYVKMALYKRAADLGHTGAVRAYSSQLEQQQQVQRQFQQRPLNEQEMQRAMLQAFGTVLRSIPRR
jgi:TPR repeat protein